MKAERETLFAWRRGTARGFDGGIDLIQGDFRVLHEGLASGRQIHAARATLEEARADLIFQIADLSAERRLRREQPLFRRFGQTAGFRHCNEVPQMPQFHGLPVRVVERITRRLSGQSSNCTSRHARSTVKASSRRPRVASRP